MTLLEPIRTKKADPAGPMTALEFRAFTRTRPQEEKWELVEGVPSVSPSPTDYHQIVVSNLIQVLGAKLEAMGSSWIVMPGIGTRIPGMPANQPQPDVFVMEHEPSGQPVTDDALAIFEVLSKSNTKPDQAWRRRVYSRVPNCQHYVTVSLKALEVTAYDRATKWAPRCVASLNSALALSALGLDVPLTRIYRRTPFGTR